MGSSRAFLTLAAMLVILAVPAGQAGAAPRDGVGFGIADPVYGQALPTESVEALAPRVYRVQIPYDITSCPNRPESAEELRERLQRVRALGVQRVLATFAMSCADFFPPGLPTWPNKLPLDDEYDAGVTSAIAAFDSLVDEWSPANEPNYPGGWFGDSIDSGGPARLAGYFKILRSRVPPGDQLVSPEFISTADRLTGAPDVYPGGGSLQRVFIRRYLKAGGGWGSHAAFHPYDAVTSLNNTSIKEFESLVQGADVWLTEIGGLVPSANHPAVADQSTQVEWLANEVASDGRIGRAYYYNPYEVTGADWDSSLLDDSGSARPAWITWCSMSNPRSTCAPGGGDSVELSGRGKTLAETRGLFDDL